ncbi:MAG: ABC transporter substrate-binding protein [Prevotellaceae bacterium]|jgi:iron complex transport system substrate-binding protein|nr:ABC transporter substrate-binding protein [Prevotellaceae bacterium]
MKNIRRNSPYFLLAALLAAGGGVFARQITDMAGRTVSVPDVITRVIPYDYKTNLLLFPLAGEKMQAKAISMNALMHSASMRYGGGEFAKLREVDTRNAEEVLKLKPEVIVVGSFTDDVGAIEGYAAFSEKVKIPLVVVDLELMKLDTTMLFLGHLLNRVGEASRCAAFIRAIYADVARLTKNPAAKRVYLANDPNGLRTAPSAGNHARLFDIMKLSNVAQLPPDAKGYANVSIEQVLIWNPEYIFCVGEGEASPYRTILKSARWRTLAATRQKQVFFVPCKPYSWFDMPPSVNRILGLIWFCKIFYNYPEEVAKEKVTTFYRIFYKHSLSDKEYAALYQWT